jgi:hypothetical protein
MTVLHFFWVKQLEGSLSTSSELHLGDHTAVLFVQLLADFLKYCYSSTVGEALVGGTDISNGFALLNPFGTHQNCSYFRVYLLK